MKVKISELAEDAESGIAAVNDVPQTPAAPTSCNVVDNVPMYGLKISWTDNSNNETGFKVERKVDDDKFWTVIYTTGENIEEYIDDTATENTSTYKYQIKATNAAGDSTPSNTDESFGNGPL